MDEAANLDAAHRYLRRLTDWDLAGVVSMYGSDMVQIQYPNRVNPHGVERNRIALTSDAEERRRQFSKHSFEVRSAMADGDRVALEVFWRGELAGPLGKLPAGAELTAHSAIFLEFRHGRIVAQRNYDCFLPVKSAG